MESIHLAFKVCRKCNTTKSIIEFPLCAECKDGTSHICKTCCTINSREWRNKNLKKAQQNEHKSKLKNRFGLTIKEYDELLVKQNYCCKICGTSQERLKRKLNVDHCHKTLKVRGLLCDRCNKGIGMFEDNPDLFKSAIKYLN